MAEENAPDTPDSPDARTSAKLPADPVRRWTLIIGVVILALLAWYLRSDRVTPFTSQARVNAIVVPIAPEISGTVTSVAVANNQPVEAGEELFQIDIQRYRLALQTAEANYEAATQAVGAAQANVKAAEAQVRSAIANLERSRQDAERMRAIREQDSGALSERRLEGAEAALKAAEASVEAARANRDRAIQDLGAEGERNSRILQAQSAIDEATLNLERATVHAPLRGVVTSVRVEKGSFAAAGAPQLTFIGVDNVWLQADFTENNLGHVDPGDTVEIVFDMLPGRVVKGTIRELTYGVAVDTAPLGSLPTVKNDPSWLRSAQRYQVLIDFALPFEEARRLKIGSQASVVVYTGEHWLANPLAAFLIRLTSILTYAY